MVTKFDKRIGFSCDDATGIVVVDAQTGAMTDYAIADAPKWVDRVQPINFIEDQLNDWGEYVHGYWNFSNSNKLQITEAVSYTHLDVYKRQGLKSILKVSKTAIQTSFIQNRKNHFVTF